MKINPDSKKIQDNNILNGDIVMKNEYYCILDIGGTKLLALLVDSRRRVLYKEKFPTISGNTIDPLVDQICDTVERARQQLKKGTELARLGICIAAFVDYRTGDLYGAPNLKIREKVAFRDILHQRLELPIVIENDANAAVLGEVKYGAAIGARNAIYVTVSTGIGGGLFLNGELYRGNNSFAGEIGHLKLFGQDPCGCGMKGCLESVASGGAMGRIARKRISPQMSCATLFEESRRENKEAMRIVNKGLESLGLTFSNLITLLNPEYIVVGGGVSREGEPLLKEIGKIIDKYLSPPFRNSVKLVRAKLDPESGIWGVYSLLHDSWGD